MGEVRNKETNVVLVLGSYYKYTDIELPIAVMLI